MRRGSLPLFLLLCFLCAAAMSRPALAQQQTPPARTAPPHVVLKLDDLVVHKGSPDGVHPAWKRIADLVRERKIKATFGIICNSLEGDQPRYFQWIKEQHASGRIEFWCHGYDHKQWTADGATLQEFKGTSFEHQRDALQKSERLAKEKLGFPLAAFGAGYNAIDENTVRALEAVPEITVWLYGNSKSPAGKLVLDRVGPVNIEQPTFVPDVEKFKAGYSRYPRRDYFVIQGHPTQWNEERFAQFVRILDFLTEQGAVFTTPSEYAAARLKAQGGPSAAANSAL